MPKGRGDIPAGVHDYAYPGEGSYDVVETVRNPPILQPSFYTNEQESAVETEVTLVEGQANEKFHKEPPKLGELRATAICANDITSSVLYTAGLVSMHADIYAPFCLALVEFLLYLFRRIYVEVVTAIPLNGGAYTALLNTTGKKLATMAGCLSFLSYVATAVVSAGTAIKYLQQIVLTAADYELDALPFTILLLCIFLVLNLAGMKESAGTAVVFFIFHMSTLALLMILCFYSACKDGFSILKANYSEWPTDGLASKLVFGFSSAMLGVSGFESSANFVEEQKPGVFAKTLRNMWVIVAFVNPVMAVLAFSVMPKADVTSEFSSTFLLYSMARSIQHDIGGSWLTYVVGIDGFCVLSGAVLTGYVGVTGLLGRMASDHILPKIFLSRNPWTNTYWLILCTFCGLCCALYAMAGGDIDIMGNVYTSAFLSVMFLFAFANLLLKYGRSSLRRDQKANVLVVFLAMFFVLFAWVSNVVKDTTVLIYLLVYFCPIFALALSMFYRNMALKAIINYLHDPLDEDCKTWQSKFRLRLIKVFQSIADEPVLYFSRDCNLRVLNDAAIYCQLYESTSVLKIVHVFESRRKIPHNLMYNVKVLDHCYPTLRLDVVLIHGVFNPEMVDRVSKLTEVPKNRMFIGCPGATFPFNVAELGGVRIINGKLERRYHYLLEVMKSKSGHDTLNTINYEQFHNTFTAAKDDERTSIVESVQNLTVRSVSDLQKLDKDCQAGSSQNSKKKGGRFRVDVLKDEHGVSSSDNLILSNTSSETNENEESNKNSITFVLKQ
eukprot:Nk52_evm54s914 gene=Nk52_evmTU54s914